MPSVDIVIVNWNSGGLLRSCVRSIDAHDGTHVAKTIIVDNGSVDGSAEVADATDTPLQVIQTGANLGFGRACNLGARHGDAPFLLFLNPDAELMAGGLDAALDWLRSPESSDIGVCGVRLVDQFGHTHRHCARFPTWRNFIGNSLGLTRIARRWFPPILMLDFDHETSRRVDHVMGAFYLIRRSLFDEVGGFDERFFVYLEDLDLSRRVHLAGYRIQYLAEARAYHKQGGTSEQVKAHRLYYSLQSNLIYAFKHFSRPAAALVAAVTCFIEPVSRSARAVFRRSPHELWFTWQGFAMFYRAAPRIVRNIKDVIAPAGQVSSAPIDDGTAGRAPRPAAKESK